ncbi:uncharacterized protein PHALS_13353 [Plasmopara halstedii]|uniref:Uncharacterized protein n=1 Tax=Plasmopara halstedii TaxID=4781 RepID=A0A0P1APK5_PLAHL|nr:uncharacterized protein PHALS_13353 [Plasmopara halstedii]CEG43137.1 hypothetical protein PHALS_13353 [Plasmopara halstedii]|eukprot:XP_024579506.1 hypothetical protein PHALS_13353 [Plasmopara halstedii]
MGSCLRRPEIPPSLRAQQRVTAEVIRKKVYAQKIKLTGNIFVERLSQQGAQGDRLGMVGASTPQSGRGRRDVPLKGETVIQR